MTTPSVALYTYSTSPRGSVVHAACLADALHDRGWDATLYALDKDRRGFFRPLRARLVLVPARPAPASTAALVRQRAAELTAFMVRRASAHDVHHAQDCLTASGLLGLRARGVSVEIVRTVHHVESFDDPYLAHCQERSIRDAATCLTVSARTERDVWSTFGVRAHRVTNGVDLTRFASVAPARVASLRARLGAGPGPIVLTVGGVEERKNTLRLLRAFARLRAHHPGCARAELWILGGASALDHGSYRASFERQLAALPGPTRAAVRELGVVEDEDVPAFFRLAGVVALPALHEGFGLAALEALAAGSPLVASNRPPFTEWLGDGCATLVDPESDQAIAAGIARALGQDRGQAGPRRCAEAYSWPRVAAQHAEHYERHVARSLRRRREVRPPDPAPRP